MLQYSMRLLNNVCPQRVWFVVLTLIVFLNAALRLIHTYHVVPVLSLCHSPSMPCRLWFRLCLYHLIYTVRPCLIHTCRAAPMPCHVRADLKATSQGHGTARHGHGVCELASAVQRQHMGDLPAFDFFRLPRGVPRSLLSEVYQSVKLQD
jgi:hypothetical protein